MVARIDKETFERSLQTPECDPIDSDDLVLALETARALEKRGDIRDAARWLRRAADQAAKDGHEARVLLLARAAAELTNALGASSTRQTMPDARTSVRPSAPARPSAPRASEKSKPVAPPDDTVTMRVAVPASMHDPRLFVVRQLAQGQPLPPGTREATLVLRR
jgi:hypothetical protein